MRTPKKSRGSLRSGRFRLGALRALLLGTLCGAPVVSGEEPDLTPVREWIGRQARLESLEGSFIQERRLRTVRRPLIREGQFWFVAPDRMRWQVGKEGVAELIAVRNEEGVLVLRPQKMEMERHSPRDLDEDDRLRGLGFLRAGFPRNADAFLRDFSVASVKRDGEYWVVEASLNDREARLALRKLVFFIEHERYRLGALRLFFRDGSEIHTRFTSLQPDVEVDAALFRPDLSGYSE